MPIQEKKRMDLEQQRAAYAWKSALECRTSEYVNLAKSAPALIMNNGLMQTLAFYESKAKDRRENDPHKTLTRHLCSWLVEREFSRSKERSFADVMKDLYGSDSGEYRRATEEALALLRWIRQFASALASKE